MSDLFEDDEDTGSVVGNDFDNVDDEINSSTEIEEAIHRDLDARRRLENMLDEKRLRDELEDFGAL